MQKCTSTVSDWTPPLILGHDLCPPAGMPSGQQDKDIFDRLDLPRALTPPDDAWVLVRQPGNDNLPPVLELVRPDGVKLSIDFSSGKARHRANEAGKGIQPLARALGLSAYRKRQGGFPGVIDATGGLGQDAWALATLGVGITVIERHPIVHALLHNALSRAAAEPATRATAARVRLLHGQAEQLLPTLQSEVIYLDPMYPERRRKKAGSRKGMQFLHALLGPPADDGNETLLSTALHSGALRVAVKRPRGAPLLNGSELWTGQRTCVESPNTRYDVYHLRSA
ncbi:class I SAM-dependent methyltransferase [Granulosicoccus sp. 3-233]|uniref:class I SAM-dependent methyltransferase n=1 Tax=Granulosicoccus sp. 3-233 TaxID=3417969 RepID=UPI003D3492BF